MAAPLLRRCCVCVRLCGAAALRVQPLFLHTGTDYRSTRSLLNTDPIRGCRYASTTAEHAGDGHLQKTTDIPVDRLTVSYSRSSGPGGQHINKVNTKAEIRFHIHTADWIPEDVRQKIIQKNKNRINKSGELFVTSEISRYQMRNFADCLQKIRDIITEASFKPREASEEDTARRKNRLEKINQERLKQKKMHSSVKQSRRVQFD